MNKRRTHPNSPLLFILIYWLMVVKTAHRIWIASSLLGNLYAQTSDTLTSERFSIHAQTTIINQYKPAFQAPYTGDNSLKTFEENQTSITSTLFMGLRLWKGASFFVNPELAGGSGLSETKGIAAATNGETFRIGNPAPKIYLARLFFQQIFALGTTEITQSSDFNQLAKKVPERYLSFTIGKVGATDFFDDNKFSHDPRTQFMSWALMANGAWDYPANTRGYTPSCVIEYVTPHNEWRYGFSLMPKEANGNAMNWNLERVNSQTLEYTHRHKIGNRDGALRALIFFTNANMGNYRQSISLNPTNPVIEDTRVNGRTKYGFGMNGEQDLTNNLGCFFRVSWNDGTNETWAFTEIDRSVSAGLSVKGQIWKRPHDNLGLAYVASGLSPDHRAYLKAGGKAFMLGDGNLNYALEQLAELYYSAELLSERLYLSGAYQLAVNPGYNKDRQGPIHVFSVRLHARI